MMSASATGTFRTLTFNFDTGDPDHPTAPGRATYYGQEHLTFEPLFGHQYSHVWVDFRGTRDEFMRAKGIDYFENSRRATLAQHAYAQDNPHNWVGYGGDIWGLTASDGPKGVRGREVNGVERNFWTYAAAPAPTKCATMARSPRLRRADRFRSPPKSPFPP